jgi:hypothetical protein
MTLPPEEELVKSAYGNLRLLDRVLKHIDPNATFQIDREAIVIEALKQHGEHLSRHNIRQTSLDASKMICWLGGNLLDCVGTESDHQTNLILDTLILALDTILYSETTAEIPANDRGLLKSFLHQEKFGNPSHGIWMNGLYMAYHCFACGCIRNHPAKN